MFTPLSPTTRREGEALRELDYQKTDVINRTHRIILREGFWLVAAGVLAVIFYKNWSKMAPAINTKFPSEIAQIFIGIVLAFWILGVATRLVQGLAYCRLEYQSVLQLASWIMRDAMDRTQQQEMANGGAAVPTSASSPPTVGMPQPADI